MGTKLAAVALVVLLGLACGCGARRAAAMKRQTRPVGGADLLFVSVQAPVSPGGLPQSTLGLMDRDGSHRRAIKEADGAGAGTWAPDGESIVYVTGSGTVRTLALPTGMLTAITLKGRSLLGSGYMPDGKRLLLAWQEGTLPNQRRGISLVDLASGRTADVAESECSLLTGVDVSPNSRWAIFGDQGQLERVGLAGSAAGRIEVFIPQEGKSMASGPIWSPKGDRIAYLLTDSYDTVPLADGTEMAVFRNSLWLYDVASGRRTKLHGPASMISGPAWHPSGTKLSFATQDYKTFQSRLWVATQGRDGWRLLPGAPFDGLLTTTAWSPDGGALAYAVARPGPKSRIYVCDADGSHPRPISPEDAYDEQPRWRPKQGPVR